MDDTILVDKPKKHRQIMLKSEEIGFAMPSDLYVGSLLKTLITSKPASNILELGTGVGLSLSWMIDGMDPYSKVTTIENDPELSKIAQGFFGHDKRVEIICEDGAEWIKNYNGAGFDLIFADAWPGKYSEIEEVLALVTVGGFYIIDDMNAQPNWPYGHQQKVDALITYLERRDDFNLTKIDWSTGIIIVARAK